MQEFNVYIGKVVNLRTASGANHIGKLEYIDKLGSVILKSGPHTICILGPHIESMTFTTESLKDLESEVAK